MKSCFKFVKTIAGLALLIITSGCTTTAMEMKILSFSNGSGVLKAPYEWSARDYAHHYCRQQPNGLGAREVNRHNLFYGFEYGFSCNYASVKREIIPERNTLIKNNTEITGDIIELSKEKCLQLGFKTGSEKFGDCVLKISK
jgi:hypothetical protein